MFDSLSFGFTVAEIQAQFAGLLGNPVVAGLIAAMIVLVFAPRLVRFIKWTVLFSDNGTGDFQPESKANQRRRQPGGDWSPVAKSIARHRRKRGSWEYEQFNRKMNGF